MRFFLTLCILLLAVPAFGFNQTRTRHAGGATWTLCDAEETDDAVCDDGTVDRGCSGRGVHHAAVRQLRRH